MGSWLLVYCKTLYFSLLIEKLFWIVLHGLWAIYNVVYKLGELETEAQGLTFWNLEGGLPYKKGLGFWLHFETLSYQDSILWTWLETFPTLRDVRSTKSKTKHHLLSCFFGLNTLKDIEKVPPPTPPVDLLKLNTRRGITTTFLTPRRYGEWCKPRNSMRCML